MVIENLNLVYNYGHKFGEFLLLYQIFFSKQVKQSVIISDKHGIYKLPRKLSNNLRLRTLGIYERSRASQNLRDL